MYTRKDIDKFLASRKGSMGTKVLVGILVTIILVVILVQFVAGTAPSVTAAGNSLNTTLGGEGLAPLFAGNNSILMLVILAGALLVAVIGILAFVKFRS